MLDLWQFKNNWKQHRERLHSIRKLKPKLSLSPTYSLDKKKRLGELYTDRQIAKDNNSLLNRLFYIMTRRNDPASTKKTIEAAGSLNVHRRKQDAYRIAHENKKFALRLVAQPSTLNVKEYECDYKRTRLYQKMRSKSNIFALSPSKNKLPSLQPELHTFDQSFHQRSTHDLQKSPYMKDYRHYESHRKQEFQSLTHRKLEYSTFFKLESVEPSADLGMDSPQAEEVRVSTE